MVALIPFFFPLLCVAIRQIKRNIHRYTFFFFVFISFYWSYLFLQTPFLAIIRGRGINNLLEQGSNNFVDPSRYFPSFSDTPSPGTYILTGMWIIVILAFSFSIYRSAQRRITPPYPPQGGISEEIPQGGISEDAPQVRIVNGLKNVGKVYALLLGLLLIFTFASEHIESNIIPLIANNKYLRELLNNFEHYAWMSQQPIAHEDLQFEYLSRRKRGLVEKRGPRFITSGPYDPFPAGKYTAYFKILAADNSTQKVIATLDIVGFRGMKLFSKRDLRGVDFAAAGQYEFMPLQFELRENVDDLETRVYFHNRVDIIVKKIYIKPDFANFYYDAGMSVFWEEQYEKAKTIFLQTLSVSNHLRARYQIGVIEQLSENWERSLEIFQQVLDDEPGFADAHYRMGLALKENNNLEKAREHFEQATSLLPSHLDAWKALQTIYRQLDMNAEAENAEETINALYQPQNPYAVNFGNQVMFLGYSVRNPTPGKLAIDYYWKALSPMKRDYAFFVHFKHYGTKFQQDHAPQIRNALTGQHTYYSTSQWQVGELVHEQFEIDVPSGTFDIHLGVWDPIYTKERLPVISSSQRFFFKKKKIKLKGITVN
jgi:tetratricopeptide (TPR) repeat protein